MSNRNTEYIWTIVNYKTNRYREVVGKDGEEPYFELEIFGDGEYHIGKIDKEFLDRFTERTWNAKKNNNNFYMRSRATIKFPDRQYFHQLVLPDVDIVDHKNRNGLDNRKKNLRDGSGVINNNNKALHNTNTSGVNGVSFDKRGKRWNATWYENGKQQKANFSITKYGSDEKAKQEAIKHRQAMNGITGSTNGDR